MPRPRIRFFSEQTDFTLSHPRKTTQWIKLVATQENVTIGELNFIFCTDEYLLDINVRYLKHKTYTDTITFDNSSRPGLLEGDIYISIDRVRENAEKYRVPFDDELHRVMVHGSLHLAGYSDKTPSESRAMKKKEDAYLSLR